MSDFHEVIETAVYAALATGLQEASNHLRREIPPNRTETRRSVYYTAAKGASEIGLKFRRNYRSHKAQESYSSKLFRRVWLSKVKPRFEKRFPEILNQELAFL